MEHKNNVPYLTYLSATAESELCGKDILSELLIDHII